MTTQQIIRVASVVLAMALPAVAVEDGLGTNHVRTLRAHDGIVLDDVKITNWTGVSASTLTNGSIGTAMIQDAAVTTGKLATAVAGDGLTGGGPDALAVGAGDGISVTADAVAVDASVVRTNGAQTLGGVKTFLESPIVPEPTTGSQAATKLYVDELMSGSLATGSAAGQTLHWDGSVWTNQAGLTVDAGGNVAVGDRLLVTGVQTNLSDLAVQGRLDVTGAAGVTGDLRVGGTQTNESNLTVEGELTVTGVQSTLTDLTVTGDAGVDGGLTVGGRTTLEGQWVATPSGTPGSPLDITAGGGITDISRAYSVIQGSGGTVTVTANPRISTTGASAGQMLTLQGASDVNWVRLDNGNGLALAGGVSFTLKQGNIIQFIYDGVTWRETFRSVPQVL